MARRPHLANLTHGAHLNGRSHQGLHVDLALCVMYIKPLPPPKSRHAYTKSGHCKVPLLAWRLGVFDWIFGARGSPFTLSLLSAAVVLSNQLPPSDT